MPGNSLELQAVDEERFTAAALFGLAGSEDGLHALLQREGQVLTGMHCCGYCFMTVPHFLHGQACQSLQPAVDAVRQGKACVKSIICVKTGQCAVVGLVLHLNTSCA